MVGTIARDKTAASPGRGNLAWLPSTRPGHLALIHTCEREENNMVLLDNDGVRISSFLQSIKGSFVL